MFRSTISDTGERTGKHLRRGLEQQVAAGPCSPSLHVAPRGGLWLVRSAHSERPIAVFATQDQAIARAWRIAAQAHTDIVVHGVDGHVRDTIATRRLERALHFHVTLADDEWIVANETSAPVSRAFQTKLEAVDAARELARNHHGVLYIHASDGAVDQVYHYDHDDEVTLPRK